MMRPALLKRPSSAEIRRMPATAQEIPLRPTSHSEGIKP